MAKQVCRRPRTISFPPEKMVELGKEMVKWVKENNPLHLSEWYTIEKMFTYNEWKTFLAREEFVPYYEMALKIVGKQYLDKTSNVRDSISQRWQRVYFKDLKEEENEQLNYQLEAEAKHKHAVQETHKDQVTDFGLKVKAEHLAQAEASNSDFQ